MPRSLPDHRTTRRTGTALSDRPGALRERIGVAVMSLVRTAFEEAGSDESGFFYTLAQHQTAPG